MKDNSIKQIFWRLPDVKHRIGGIANSTIWDWVKKGTFPAPVKLSANVSAWRVEDVEAWAAARIAESNRKQ